MLEGRVGKQRKRFKYVTCECGFKILLTPDLTMMANAIEAHLLEHCKKEKDITTAEMDRLWKSLINKVFENAIESV